MAGRTIQKIKESHESELMALPGVTAVGIGLTGDRKECIMVYVDGEVSKERVPKEIEGYPVEVRVRGTFRAL